MKAFNYLVEKIKEAPFLDQPFSHITIENFFTEKHFSMLVGSPEIKLEPQSGNRQLLRSLQDMGYLPVEFPGCITDVDEYVKFADGKTSFDRRMVQGYGRGVIEGYGITMRLAHYESQFLYDITSFLNSDFFLDALLAKFGIDEQVEIETAIQKNLNHYEISPHCDTSRKALTYMVNIYSDNECETLDMHTHLLRFKEPYRYLYDLWKYNRDIDPVWVPWGWCESKKRTNRNNSITIFKPDFDSLHAVKLDYDHLKYQRNQIYGNLWYLDSKAERTIPWQRLDMTVGGEQASIEKIGYHLKEAARNLRQLFRS